MGGRKHSLNFVGPKQGQKPPVFFYTTYRFENIIISFDIMKSQKNRIYCAHTSVDPGMSQHWRHHVDTPTTLPELSTPIQPRWSEHNISPYATSSIGHPYGSIVLRNITKNRKKKTMT